MLKIIIRSIKLDDAKAVYHLIQQLSEPIEQQDIIHNIKHYIYHLDYELMVAEEVSNNKIVGFVAINLAVFFHRKNPMGRIMGLVVDINYRKQGIGKLLMNKAEELAAEKGCNIIELTSGINRKNMGTFNFYEQCGYENKVNQKIYLRKVIK